MKKRLCATKYSHTGVVITQNDKWSFRKTDLDDLRWLLTASVETIECQYDFSVEVLSIIVDHLADSLKSLTIDVTNNTTNEGWRIILTKFPNLKTVTAYKYDNHPHSEFPQAFTENIENICIEKFSMEGYSGKFGQYISTIIGRLRSLKKLSFVGCGNILESDYVLYNIFGRVQRNFEELYISHCTFSKLLYHVNVYRFQEVLEKYQVQIIHLELQSVILDVDDCEELLVKFLNKNHLTYVDPSSSDRPGDIHKRELFQAIYNTTVLERLDYLPQNSTYLHEWNSTCDTWNENRKKKLKKSINGIFVRVS